VKRAPRAHWRWLLFASALPACHSLPQWQADLPAALSASRQAGQELVVYFALPGRVASDRMHAALADAQVLGALADGGFAAVVADGSLRARLYTDWIGGGEGMGIAVLDAAGMVYAARPGPQDPPELAAFLRRCAAARGPLAAARAQLASRGGAADQLALGTLLLELGCRTAAEPLLLAAAVGGEFAARHRLARLYALDGHVVAARRWQPRAPDLPEALVTEGYLLFKERRHAESAAMFERALARGGLGDDRQRALLYLAKARHENGEDAVAVPLLEALVAEHSGSVFEAAAMHTLQHLRDPQHGHAH